MAGGMALEGEHALAAARQLMDSRAAHDAETADDDIEMGHSQSRYYVAIRRDITAVKLLLALIVLAGLCDAAVAVPLPRPRPAQAPTMSVPDTARPEKSEVPPPPSACRLRLTTDWAIAPSLPALTGGECGVDDVVHLEAVVLADKTRVAVTPPATMRCSFAEAIVHWVREDVVPAVRALDGAALKSVDNYASYDCRGRNRIVGAKLSEHGKANALDVRSVKLANGAVLGLTDPQVAKEFREGLKKVTCARFTTVLGPGSDGYHEDHVHMDLAERRGGYRMCQWDVREPGEEPAVVAHVPLPRPRPNMTVKQ
jgi:hypothetical protein